MRRSARSLREGRRRLGMSREVMVVSIMAVMAMVVGVVEAVDMVGEEVVVAVALGEAEVEVVVASEATGKQLAQWLFIISAGVVQRHGKGVEART